MQFNDSEKRKIFDEGMLTRSAIECEVSMRKCSMYSELAGDPTIKSFFRDQAKGLEDALGYIKSGLADLK